MRLTCVQVLPASRRRHLVPRKPNDVTRAQAFYRGSEDDVLSSCCVMFHTFERMDDDLRRILAQVLARLEVLTVDSGLCKTSQYWGLGVEL